MSPTTPLQGDLFTRLRYGLDNFSNQQQLVCRFILDSYQEVAFMTVEELSQASGASPATVVRTVSSLKYDTFHQLLQKIQKMLISPDTSPCWQVEKSEKKQGTPDFLPEERTLSEISRQSIESIEKNLSPLLMRNFKIACDLLKKCERLSILGLRSSRGAALFCYSMLHQFMDNVSLPDHTDTEEIYSELLSLSSKDVLLAMSVEEPFQACKTIDAIEFAHDRGISVILITSDIACPAAQFTDVALNISATNGHYSMIPALTVIEALIVELKHHHRDRALKKRKTLEKFLSEKKITL